MAEAWAERPLRGLIDKPVPGFWGEDISGLGLRSVRVVRNGDAASHYTLTEDDLALRWMHTAQIAKAGCRVNDVLLASSGEVGAVARLERTGGEVVVASNFVRRVRAREGIEASWLFFVLQTGLARDAARRCSGGTTLQNLSGRFFDELLVPVPPRREQRRIAEILDTVDEAIFSTERLIAKLAQVKQGLLHDLLTRGIDGKGGVRPSIDVRPDLYCEGPGGQVPKEWDVGLLDSFATRGSGHTPNKNVPSYWDGGIRWVSLADSERLDNVWIQETDKEISDLGLANSSAVKHVDGTVILSRDAGVGKSAILVGTMAVSQHFMAWTCGPRLNNMYLYYWLQRSKPRFEAIAMGSTIKTIGLPYFRRLEIAVPSGREQAVVADVMLHSDRLIWKARIELDKLRAVKAGLIEDLLSGRVRVKGDEGVA
jgi:type I restriction enzyme S subunit